MKADRREQRRFRRRYAPTTTNPGLRTLARDLAREAQQGCPVCGQVGVHRPLSEAEKRLLSR